MDNFFIWAKEVVGIGSREMKLFYEENMAELRSIFSDDTNIISIGKLASHTGVDKAPRQDRLQEPEVCIGVRSFIDWILSIGNSYFSKKVMDKIRKYGYDQTLIDEIKNNISSSKVLLVTYDSEDYPSLLRNVYDPPYILYYYGDISIVNNYPFLSVVGARKCTDYGKNASKYLVKDLSEAGIGVVSGLALGIDSYAHSYCMDGGSPTIAVMGTAIDNIYPRSNTRLFKEIIDKGGLVLSETGPGGQTFRASFAMRNRIIAGLSRGTLVIEAGKKSGSLITATYGLDNGREVYLVPGSIFSELSYGCNEMISKGGKIVQTSRDILEDYESFYSFDSLNNKKNKKNASNIDSVCDNIRNDKLERQQFSEHEQAILKLLSEKGALDIDKISLYLNIEIGDVIFYVNKLTMMDYILEVGINTYELSRILII